MMEKYEMERWQRENMKIFARNTGSLLYYIYPQEKGEK